MEGLTLIMMLKNYQSNQHSSLMIGYSLFEQYQNLLDSIIEVKPEWAINLISIDPNLTEFHHTLWTLPFYKKIYKLNSIKNLFGLQNIDVYCSVVDSFDDSILLCGMKLWYVKYSTIFKKIDIKYASITSRNPEFNRLFLELLNNPNNISYDELPVMLRDKIILDW